MWVCPVSRNQSSILGGHLTWSMGFSSNLPAAILNYEAARRADASAVIAATLNSSICGGTTPNPIPFIPTQSQPWPRRKEPWSSPDHRSVYRSDEVVFSNCDHGEIEDTHLCLVLNAAAGCLAGKHCYFLTVLNLNKTMAVTGKPPQKKLFPSLKWRFKASLLGISM